MFFFLPPNHTYTAYHGPVLNLLTCNANLPFKNEKCFQELLGLFDLEDALWTKDITVYPTTG